jgi:hypothetical protein
MPELMKFGCLKVDEVEGRRTEGGSTCDVCRWYDDRIISWLGAVR